MIVDDQGYYLSAFTSEQDQEVSARLTELGWLFLLRDLEDTHMAIYKKHLLRLGGNRIQVSYEQLLTALNRTVQQWDQAGHFPTHRFVYDTLSSVS